MIKPDGVARGLVNEILNRVTQSGLKIVKQKKLSLSLEQAAQLYQPHYGKDFYNGLVSFITSGPVVSTVVEGEGAIVKIRELMGQTDPRQADKGTIRGDLHEENIFSPAGTMKNLVHGSDSPESAAREIAIFFK
jgi:nucleoside-diphosphate kinase